MEHFIGYDLARGLHIIAVIAWVAGLLMLPRFYAYIAAATPGGETEAAMLKAAKSLRTIIVVPAMIVTWSFGVFLFATYLVGDWARPFGEIVASVPTWFWLKLILVIILSGYQGFLSSQGRRIAAGERPHSEKFWRMTGEIPFVIAILAVLLATLEPWRGGAS